MYLKVLTTLIKIIKDMKKTINLDRSRFQHEQHSSKFNTELNTPNQNTQQPFYISNMKWAIGKHKGKKLDETPKTYIKWILDTFKHLGSTHKSILQKMI
jgi:hypothetical protein